MPKRGLGRGLEALIPEGVLAPQDKVQEVAVVAVRPNPYQPRRHFGEEELRELAQSIQRHGVLQPLIVRRRDEGYELVAGERRLRAAVLAGLEKVPVVVRDVPEERMLEIALVENLQRQDLDPIEEARGYEMLLGRGLSQEEVAELVGKSRPAVANAIRLLQLPPSVQAMVSRGELSAGQARALLALPKGEIERVAERARREGLRVRDLERLAKREGGARRERRLFPRHWEERLAERFGTKVEIRGRGERGEIVLRFRSRAELLALLEELLGEVGDEEV